MTVPEKRVARRYSGVRISNQKLVIATIERAGSGELRLAPEHSQVFQLAGREQGDLHELFREVLAFVRSKRINSITIRAAPPRGTHRGSGLGFKIEALLQFLPYVSVRTVPAMTVTCWNQRTDPRLPEPDREHLGSAMAKVQLDAIQVAAWAADHVEALEANDGEGPVLLPLRLALRTSASAASDDRIDVPCLPRVRHLE